jgi:hypothetical protein
MKENDVEVFVESVLSYTGPDFGAYLLGSLAAAIGQAAVRIDACPACLAEDVAGLVVQRVETHGQEHAHKQETLQ